MEPIYDEIFRLKRRMDVLHLENMAILQCMLPKESYGKLKDVFDKSLASCDELGSADNGKDN